MKQQSIKDDLDILIIKVGNLEKRLDKIQSNLDKLKEQIKRENRTNLKHKGGEVG